MGPNTKPCLFCRHRAADPRPGGPIWPAIAHNPPHAHPRDPPGFPPLSRNCPFGTSIHLEGGHAWTAYLGPKDYHRIHAPCTGELTHARWIPGCRYSVQPKVLARRQVLAINERCPLRIETPAGPLFMVLVGAVIVGRIRVVGLPPDGDRRVDPPRPLEVGQ
ncbi:MAG: phosphatidylserine decarboxylase, partial [bacterium]|nr:phosphatidylserine decarboxylase [bacterium]